MKFCIFLVVKKPNQIFIYIYEVEIKSVLLSSLFLERYFYKI
jgi:hypothetical protein